ncbi:hypothetical protein CEXT_69371 [Caerostris extrusa]|uniref:Uncharacterized protein n=1 Tax=Caerostris extrusa TaxID=172846 RepID=A0AAV4XKR4_CAEEX|nr:hypothetical protein CEXT_69371 [Caerostris extrusa]
MKCKSEIKRIIDLKTKRNYCKNKRQRRRERTGKKDQQMKQGQRQWIGLFDEPSSIIQAPTYYTQFEGGNETTATKPP